MSISLEAFDDSVRGRYIHWIVPHDGPCSLPHGFQDQVLIGSTQFQCHILLHTKQDNRAWLLAFPWEMTFCPETPTEWSLLLSILQHLRKPVLIVTTPTCRVPDAFWAKCLSMPAPSPTCVSLLYATTPSPGASHLQPHVIFFPSLQTMAEDEFQKASTCLSAPASNTLQSLDLRTLYRELRGAGASLCLSQIDSRHGPGSLAHYTAMWFYPEMNGSLRIQLSELRTILKTITDRLGETA